jgi:hypothetical protein
MAETARTDPIGAEVAERDAYAHGAGRERRQRDADETEVLAVDALAAAAQRAAAWADWRRPSDSPAEADRAGRGSGKSAARTAIARSDPRAAWCPDRRAPRQGWIALALT